MLDRTDESQVDCLLPETLPQNTAGVRSEPLAGLRRIGNIHLDQSQHISVDDALIPQEPSRRVMAEDEEGAAAEPVSELGRRLEALDFPGGLELLCYTPEEFEQKRTELGIVRVALEEGFDLEPPLPTPGRIGT